MLKKTAVLLAILAVLGVQRPAAQGPGTAKVFFVDIGQGAATLIVSPAGKTLLVDGGPDGAGTRIETLLDTLGIATIDYTVLTHYHIDHDAGLTEVLNAGRVAGIAYDNGDAPAVAPPGTSTSPQSTRGHYLNYVAATAHPGVTRQLAVPGTAIDLGGGMRATIVAAGGQIVTGGSVAISNTDLNTESVSVLVEYGTFDFLVSGDLTGGGSTATATTPDVETPVAQAVGDVDIVQLNHHGSTTASNQRFLSMLRAEVAVAEASNNNSFGHPNRETVNKYLNTPTTTGASFTGTTVPPAGVPPVFYQIEQPVPGDDRVTQQGISANGTILVQTDGATSYTVSSFDDGGVQINPAANTYVLDGVSAGLTSDFKPSVLPAISPTVPQATDAVTVSALVNDRESPIASVTLNYSVDGIAQAPQAMALAAGSTYQATIPPQPDGTRVDFVVSAVAGGQTSTYASGYFSGTTPISALRVLNSKGEPLYAGYAARIAATVTAGSGTFGNGTNDDYVQDASGAINVWRTIEPAAPDVPVYQPTSLGQSVEVAGRIGSNVGRLRLEVTPPFASPTTPYTITTLGTPGAPAPLTVTLAQINADPESYEGHLVSVANATVTAGTIPATAQFDSFITVSDGTAALTVKIDHDTDIPGFPTPAAPFTLVGIVQQDDPLRPFDAAYDLAPRGRVDMGGAAAGGPLVTIGEARIDEVTNTDGNPPPDFVPDLKGQTVRVRGTVTSVDFRGGNGVEYYIQDATGGMDIFNSSTNFGPFNVGDSVEVIGTITQFNGLTEIDPGTTLSHVTLLPGGSTPPVTPQVVTLSQLADGGVGEALEGRLIRVDNVTASSAGLFLANSNVTIADATGTATLRIDGDTNVDGAPIPTGPFSVIGVLGQFDTTAPFDSGYQLFPRTLSDIIAIVPPVGATPSSISFGTVNVGFTSTHTLTISNNTSVSPIALTPPFAIVGADPAHFSVDPTLPITLPLGDSTTVSVNFAPLSAGSKNAALVITWVGGSTSVPLNGTGNLVPVLTAAPASIAFGTINIGASAASTVTLTNNSASSITLDVPFSLTGSNPDQFGAGSPAATTLTAGGSTTVQVSFAPTSGGSKFATLNVSTTGGGSASVTLNGTGQAVVSTAVVISEFRVRGPSGGNDEFVEIYNNTDAPINIGGWKMKGANNATPTPAISTRATVPAGVTLPARGHYLFVNTAASGYSGAVPGNANYTTGIVDEGGVAITMPDDTIVDQVGLSATAGFKEGTNLPTLGTTTAANLNRGYERKLGGVEGSQVDTNNNANDFTVKTPSDPQNLASAPTPAISTNSSIVLFAATEVGQTRLASINVVNNAAAPITLNAPFTIGGASAAEFSVGAPSTTTLAPSGGTATIPLTFAPTSVGSKGAALSIATSGGSRTVTLSGSATQGTPELTWPSPAPIGYGTALAATQLNATSSVSGSFAYTPDAGTVLDAGPAQTLTAVFTPADPVNYAGGTVTTTIDVLPAPLTVTADNASRMYGAANPTFTGTLVGVLNGDAIAAAFGTAATQTSGVGLYAIVPVLDDPNGRLANYSVTIVNGTLTVGPAPLSVTPNDATREVGAPNPAFTGIIAGLLNGDPITATYATTATPASPVGSYPIVATLADPAGRLGNYTLTPSTGTLHVIDTIAPVVTATASQTSLSPPNHKMVDIALALSAADASGAVPTLRIAAVSSNEPQDGLGDGDTPEDWVLTGASTLRLRAERSGTGGGRIYSILVEAIDASGNRGTTTVVVTVPR